MVEKRGGVTIAVMADKLCYGCNGGCGRGRKVVVKRRWQHWRQCRWWRRKKIKRGVKEDEKEVTKTVFSYYCSVLY